MEKYYKPVCSKPKGVSEQCHHTKCIYERKMLHNKLFFFQITFCNMLLQEFAFIQHFCAGAMSRLICTHVVRTCKNRFTQIINQRKFTVRATKSGRDLPLERKSLLFKTGDR